VRRGGYGLHVVAAAAKDVRDVGRQHLVEEELHRVSAACPATQAARASSAIRSLSAMSSSTSPV